MRLALKATFSQGGKRLGRFFLRLDVAAGLLFLILVAAGIGSFFPQLPPSQDPSQLKLWQKALEERYGTHFEFLQALGVFHLGRSPLLLVPLVLTSGAALFCTSKRWRALWQQLSSFPPLPNRQALEDAPFTFSLLPPDDPSTFWARALQELRERGFSTHLSETGEGTWLQGIRHRWALGGTLCTHLAILLLFLGGLISLGAAQRVEITLPPD
ncbi:MAG: cytochrome c biogenesis protein ResB, partial [Anaerolineae bacterium]|nr:cytochrome c biogenesis protein ResB [Anaerolineae bacterium]